MSNRRRRARGRVEEVVENLETSNQSKNDDNDISFMDTEPMDVSTLNTEPMELNDSDEDDEAIGSGSETSVTDVENEKESDKCDGSNNENESDHLDADDNDNSANESDSDAQSLVDFDFRDDISQMFDDSSSGSSQPPAVDITMASSHEVKRIYSDLIDSCRGFDDDLTFGEGSNKRVLKDNIKTGQVLFQQLELTLSNTFSESEKDTSENPLQSQKKDNSVVEMLLACQHTKHCASMLGHAVNNAMNVEAVFKVDEFLNNLQNSCLDKEGGYSVLSFVRKLAFTASTVSYSVSHFKTVMGCINTDSFRSQDEPVLEITKVRPKRIKDEIKEEDATQMEIVNEKSKPSISDHSEIKNDTPDGLASDILRSVRNNFKDQGAPVNVLQVAHSDNLPDVISRLFGVAFLVRDGFVSLNTPGGDVDPVASCTALTLKPDKPPKNEKDEVVRKQRNQHIASFSVRLLKHLVASGKDADE